MLGYMGMETPSALSLILNGTQGKGLNQTELVLGHSLVLRGDRGSVLILLYLV